MVVITAAGGMWLAPGGIALSTALWMLLTTAMVVGGANALNCYIERDVDRLMVRTQKRPLPDGRLAPNYALGLGVALGVVSVPLLAWRVNMLTGVLGLIALVSYVAMYTPMKKVTPTALLVGAVPGALPPLMGWTAATGQIQAPGLALFAILFFWQLPHFIAISIFRQDEYERAGLKVLPSVRGLKTAKAYALLHTVLLVVSSLWLYALGTAGPIYLCAAVALGAWFTWVAALGLRPDAKEAWAKRLFVTSLIYLTALFAALLVDVL